MGRKLVGVFFILMLAGAICFILLSGGLAPLKKALTSKYNPLEQTEAVLARQFPGADFLRALQVSINYMGGSKEQNGVFIAEDMLMLDVQPNDPKTVTANTQAILSLSKRLGRPSYVMLIPTACVIQQHKVPYNSVAPLFNQQRLIDDVYRTMSGELTAIDVYPTLFNHQDEYLYYRTDNSPTGLGGYYIYSAAAKKLGLQNPRGIEMFDQNHIDYQYYGDLYALSPYRAVEPDRITAYIFSQFQQNYRVTHYDAAGGRRYFTLYPDYMGELGDSKKIILGGVSPIVDIENGSPQQARDLKLLILGDSSMQSYLPFLLIHYGRVTFVDSAAVTEDLLDRLDFSEYSQVLFAYSVDNFLSAQQLTTLSAYSPPGSENGSGGS